MHASPNRRTTLRVVNLPNTIDSESRPTIRHRPLPSRAPGAFSLKAIVTVAWGFSTQGPMAASHPRTFSRCFAAAGGKTSGRPFRSMLAVSPFGPSVTMDRQSSHDSPSREPSKHNRLGESTDYSSPPPPRAPGVFAEGDCYRSLGFLYPRTHGRATSPAHFPDVLPPQAAKHRAVPFAPCWPFPRSVRPLPWTAHRRTTLRVVNLPTEIDSESRPTIRHRPLPSRAPRRVFAEGDQHRSLGFPYPRTHGRATSPAHFPDVLPPQAAKHRGVPFAHVGRFPVRSVRYHGPPIVGRLSES